MLIQFNDERIKVMPVKHILLLNKCSIIGFSNNSKTFTLNLLTETFDNIRLMGTSWGEYLEMIRYSRQLLKKNNTKEVL